ncbi:MAG: ABC transporter transmembrane domain-containing protein, partial [Planctomycetota bacterium]
MRNFGRVVKLALRYRYTFLASACCALLVGLLWGASISTVYPFVQVAFEGQTLQEAVDAKILETGHGAGRLANEVDRLEKRLAEAAPDAKPEIRRALEKAEVDLEDEREAFEWYCWARPYVYRYMPRDLFETVALLIGFLLLGTVLKSLFVFAHFVLVARLAQLGTFDLRKLFYRRTLRMDLATFSSEGTADLMSRFTYDMNAVAAGLNVLFGKLVREPLKMITCLAVAAWISWPLLLLSLAVAPVAALLIRWLARMLRKANRRAMEEMAQLY